MARKKGLFFDRSTKGKYTAYDDLNIVNYKVLVSIIKLLLTNGDIESHAGSV